MAKKIKWISKIIECILDISIIIVSIVIIIGIYYIAQVKVLKNDYASLFGYTFFEVATGSMFPTIEIGDVVVVQITQDVFEDDIIVYKDGKNFVTHRLIEKKDDIFITKGDANNAEDNPISKENMLGKVIKIIPNIGIWRKVILSPEIVILIFALIIVFGITFVYNSKSEEKND